MNFSPAIPLLSLKKNSGHGGIAANVDGTLVASVDSHRHCVHIYNVNSAGESTRERKVQLSSVHGNTTSHLNYPTSACFVRRSGVDSLLIVDNHNQRVVETTAAGEFIRAIPVDFFPWSVAYCSRNDGIAVSGCYESCVVLLQYESLETVFTIRTGESQ